MKTGKTKPTRGKTTLVGKIKTHKTFTLNYTGTRQDLQDHNLRQYSQGIHMARGTGQQTQGDQIGRNRH